jgi:hypothetical protein
VITTGVVLMIKRLRAFNPYPTRMTLTMVEDSRPPKNRTPTEQPHPYGGRLRVCALRHGYTEAGVPSNDPLMTHVW